MADKSTIAPRLVIIEGKDKGKVIPLKDGTTVIGRTKGDVVIQDPRVSRSHVAIHFDAATGTLSCTDLKSLNGTTVNGAAVESGELNDGDRIQLGDTVFDCQIGAPVNEEHSVSKAREELRRHQEPAPPPPKRKKEVPTELKAEHAPKEPKLLPVDEAPGAPEDEEAKPDTPGEAAPAAEQAPRKNRKLSLPRPRLNLGGLTAAYRRLPERTRRITLVLVLLLFVYGYLDDQPPSTERPVSEVAETAENPAMAGLLREARALAGQGKFQEAMAKAGEARDVAPEDSRPYLFLGDLFAAQNQHELAIDSYAKAYKREPYNPVVHVRLVRSLLSAAAVQQESGQQDLYLKNAREQLAQVDEWIAKGKHSRELFLELGQLYLDYRDLEGGAEKMLIIAMALQKEHAPNHPLGYKLEAQALFQRRENEKALAALQRANQLDPQDPWVLENLAFAHLSLKDYEGATRTITEWIERYPKASKALLVMAYLKMNNNQTREALPFVRRIVDNARENRGDPHVGEALYLMGQIYYKENQINDAAALFEQSCRLGFRQACNQNLTADASGAPPSDVPQGEPSAPAPDAGGAPGPATGGADPDAASSPADETVP